MEALMCVKLKDPAGKMDEDSPIILRKGLPIPELDSPTAVRVKVKATRLNYANYLQISGKSRENLRLPFIPGSDYSGIVDAVGPSVSNFKVGDRVCSYASFGSFARFILADQSQLFSVPETCDLVSAAALPVAYGIPHVALVNKAQLSSSQVLLVLCGVRGIGIPAAQIGKISGAIIIAVARCAEQIEVLKSLGVDHVVDLRKESVTVSVRNFLLAKKLKGIDVLFDPVGGKLAKEALELLNLGAKILIVGFSSGNIPVLPTNTVLLKNWTIHGLSWTTCWIHQPVLVEGSLKELLSWMENSLFTIDISYSFGISEANLAFAAITDGKATGKVLITFDDERSQELKLDSMRI